MHKQFSQKLSALVRVLIDGCVNSLTDNIEKAAQCIDKADALLITAGAGMGVDSGLPDFRGNEGFWKAYPPIAELGITFYEMANPEWFREDPHLAWGFYGHRLNLYRDTVPHNGFHLLMDIASTKKYGYFVFTSNVDGQFQMAGFNDEFVEECHGSIHHLQCAGPCCESIWLADDIHVDVDEQTFRAGEPLPSCIHCGSVARPNILMFGDWGWLWGRSQEQTFRFNQWLNSVPDRKLAIIEVGAGTAVPTVRIKSDYIAKAKIRINPREPDVRTGHLAIPLNGEEGIDKIINTI